VKMSLLGGTDGSSKREGPLRSEVWMLVQMLDPTLFNSPAEMFEQRHRLNTVIFRRTKADGFEAKLIAWVEAMN
jgi:hypothetical protein